MNDLGTYLIVYEVDGSRLNVEASEERRLNAAVSGYLTTNRDDLIDLTTIDGATYTVPVSRIVSWITSTPETRERAMLNEAADRAERHQHRASAGLPWEDDD